MSQTENPAKRDEARLPHEGRSEQEGEARREGSCSREGRPREAGREEGALRGPQREVSRQLVELRAVRTTKLAPCGYDVRLALGDGAQ
jgi:hypothetical protein